jgi:uncharacterized membrane protein YoaK (UPF0700 family)
VLVLGAALADLEGAHGVARTALLAAVPFAAVAAIAAFGECLGRRDGLATAQAVLSSLVVALLVLSCAIRSGAVQGVPPAAVSALLGAVALFALKAVLACAPHVRRLSELWPAKP